MSEYKCSGKIHNGEKAIISLTSWKARINKVSKTIYSLIKQCPEFHIVLVLSEEEFPKKEAELPDDLMLFVENELIELLWVYKNYYIRLTDIIHKKYPNVNVINADSNKIYYDKNKLIEKRKILCADYPLEENNAYGLFLHLKNNYNDILDVRYLSDNKELQEKYPDSVFSFEQKNYNIDWADTICYSYGILGIIPQDKTTVFLQHGITWCHADKYINKILNYSTYSSCTVDRELNYFDSFDTNCINVLAGMAIYDYDLLTAKTNNELVIMFTSRDKPWLNEFINSKYWKILHDKYKLKISFIMHHDDLRYGFNKNINVPKHINEVSVSECGKLVRNCRFLITDYSSISFKASYLNKSVYYFQPDYESYQSNKIKSQGWYDWKTEALGFRTNEIEKLFENISKEIKGKFSNDRKIKFFNYLDKNNCERICKRILGV